MKARALLRLAGSVLSSAVVLLNVGYGSGQATDPRLQKIIADWKNRQEKLVGLSYQVRGEVLLPSGANSGPFGKELPSPTPPSDIMIKIERDFAVDFAKGRFRLREEVFNYDEMSNRLRVRPCLRVFDGAMMRTLWLAKPLQDMGEEQQRDVAMNLADGYLQENVPLGGWLSPILLGHGIVPSRLGGVHAHRLKILPDAEFLYVHGQGVHQGRSCLVVRSRAIGHRSQSYDEFWVDPSRDSSVLRRTVVTDDQPQSDFDISYRRGADGGLPERWTMTQRHIYLRKTVWVERLEVVAGGAVSAIREEDFKLEPEPGMLVQKTTYFKNDPGKPISEAQAPAKKYYRTDEQGRLREVRFDGNIERSSGSWFVWAAVAISCAGVVLAVLLLWRSYRRA